MAEDRPRLRRIQHPVRLLGVVLAICVGLAGSFLIGRFIQAPSRDALIAAQQPIVVTADVEMRVVDDSHRFAGSVVGGDSMDLFADAIAAPSVVTRATVSAGTSVGAGTLIGVVSGAPVFSLPSPLPLYRDLVVGDRGDDVVALQTALVAAGLEPGSSGVIDRATYAAVRILIRAAGGDLPWGAPIPYRQFLPIPASGAVVVEAAALGDHLSSEKPLVTLRISTPSVVFRADAVAAAQLTVGEAMSVQIGSTDIDATVTRIGEFDEGAAGMQPGRDVVLGSPDPALAAAIAGSPAIVSTSGTQTEPALAVPVTALRRDEHGDYVEVDHSARGDEKPVRVDVVVLRAGGGWVALEEGSDLRVGDRVRVS